jgi:hypothetical protein
VKRLAIVLVLALAGCTSTAPAPVATSSTPAAPVVQALVPIVPETLDAATAETETERLADAIQSLITDTDIIFVDAHAQVIDATDSTEPYYGVIRTITINAATDPVVLAQSISGLLKASGWNEDETTEDVGLTLDALDQSGWFLLLGGDSSVANQSVITIQLASPDLPE